MWAALIIGVVCVVVVMGVRAVGRRDTERRRPGNSGITILLITSRTVNTEELNGLLVELLFHLYHEVTEVRTAYERGEFSQDSFDKYAVRMTCQEIEQGARALRIRDWGEVNRSKEALSLITGYLSGAGVGGVTQAPKRIYGCYFNVVGRTMALPSNTRCTVRDVAFLGLALLGAVPK